MKFEFTRKRLIVFLIYVGLLTAGYLLYVNYPAIEFWFQKSNIEEETFADLPDEVRKQIDQINDIEPETVNDGKQHEETQTTYFSNHLIIPKIGVNSEIIEGQSLNILNTKEGVWREPSTSDPILGGNMVIAGHRWQYLPPNMTTFYLLPELVEGDEIYMYWDGKTYKYEITRSYETVRTDSSVYDEIGEHILTIYTCTPLETGVNRHVVVAKLVESSESDI